MKKVYIFILILLHLTTSGQKYINMYALYTPSHEILVNTFFKPSLKDPYIKLILYKEPEQTSDSARFMSNGWTKTTIKKIKLVLHAINENWNKIFIFSDVDIQFFGNMYSPIITLMKNHDFLIQKDNPKGTLCSGFFVVRANEKTKQLFTDILNYMEQNQQSSDQKTLNKYLSRHSKHNNSYSLTWDYLPTDLFFGGGTFSGKYWYENDTLIVPKTALMHHANWVTGIKGKIKQLIHVQKKRFS